MGVKTITLPNGRIIGDGQPAFIVGEIGQNHQGDRVTAGQLIELAWTAGCDAAKLTKRDVRSDLTAEAYNRPYEGPQSFGATYGEHREKLELSRFCLENIANRVRLNPAGLFFTACDIASVELLEEVFSPDLYKVASRDIDNIPLIEHIAKTGKPVVLSTGFAGVYYPHDLEDACDAIRKHHDDIVMLYCVSKYPTPDEDIALRNIERLRQRLDVLVGFSDHTIGIHLGVAAVQVGACVIEKHITLARANKGTDHAASLEPEALGRYVRNIRAIEAAMARDTEPVLPDDQTVERLGRSLVTRRPITPGEVVTEEMLTLKSPGDGTRWHERETVIGNAPLVRIEADTTIDGAPCLRAWPDTSPDSNKE